MLSDRPGQEDFPFRQAPFHSHLPNGKGIGKSSANKSLKEQAKTCPGQANFEKHMSQGQSRIQVSFKPCN